MQSNPAEGCADKNHPPRGASVEESPHSPLERADRTQTWSGGREGKYRTPLLGARDRTYPRERVGKDGNYYWEHAGWDGTLSQRAREMG